MQNKRRYPGRPRIAGSERMDAQLCIRCSRDMRDAIEADAKRLKCSMSAVAERWLEKGQLVEQWQYNQVTETIAKPLNPDSTNRRRA